MLKYRIVHILVIYAIVGCGSSVDRFEIERDVYKALFEYMGAGDLKTLVIREDSMTDIDRMGGEKNKNKLEDEAYKAFISINKKESLLPIDSQWDHRVILLSKEDLDGIFNKSSLDRSWKAYYQKFPDSTGLFGLSRVGFNKDLDEAFLYIEIECGSTCGNGYHAWMSRGLFGWKVDYLEHLWIS
jgi:hypothetical protein